jgi:hypothetical protein
VKESDIFVARSRNTTNAHLVDHVDVALGFAARAADIECGRNAALEHV